MSYIGSTPTTQSFISGTDYFNGDGSTTAFTLSRSIVSVNDIEAVINNVEQQPNTAYTVSGTTITFTSAPSAGSSNIYVRYLSTTTQSITPSQGTVGNSQFANNISAIPMTYGTIGAGDASIMKNRIINGAMQIFQRGSSVTSSGYFVDRWQYVASQSSKGTANQSSTAPAGFINSSIFTSSSAYTVLTGDYFVFQQGIEGLNISDLGWGSANAKTVTLSFWVQSSLTGTFGGGLVNSNGTRSYPFNYTISAANTWQQVSITIVGDTTGTWLTTNGVGINVTFGLGVGSTFSGTAGSWSAGNYPSATGATSVVGTSGATFYITGVQLEVGSSATGFEYRQYGQELALCQRYYEMSFSQGTAPANGVGNTYKFIASALNGGTSYVNAGVYCTEKRATPTMTFYRTDNGSSNGQPAYYSGGWNNGSSISPTSGTRAFYFNFAGTFSGLSCYFVDVAWTSSAEL